MTSSVLEIEKIDTIGFAIDRKPETVSPRQIPAGTVIISSDSHWLEGDIWVDRFPEHLRDRAPRVRFENGGWEVYIGDKQITLLGTAAASCTFECVPGESQVEPRLADLDAEGVHQEILFPQKFFNLLLLQNFEEKEWVARAYNQGLAEFCGQAPGRLHGVAILNWWDPDATRDALAEIKAMGFKTAMVPIQPGKFADGEPIHYHTERMDRFWDAIEEAGLPICFHIGERPINPSKSPRGMQGINFMQQLGGMRNVWSMMTFGGVYERNPGLRTVFVESQLHWVPGALHDADLTYASFGDQVIPRLAHPPSYYWHQNCYATFMVDPVGLSMLDRIGADRCLWSSDYPHNESTFGYTRSAVAAVFDATSEENARKIVGENAIELRPVPLTGMKVGIAINGLNPARLVEIARKVEELGFESAWRGEHIAVPLEIPHNYPYREHGTPPFPPDWPILDTIVLLTHLAACTTRLRFGTGVLIAPLRSPVLLARQLTTMDVVSNGRLIVGVGVGWLAPEFDIVGQDFPSRGPRTDEFIQILRSLWTQKHASFAGKHYSLAPMAFEPKPVSKPHPPILVGGQSKVALRRAARLGDGWYGVDLDLETAHNIVKEIARLRADGPLAGQPFDNTLLLQDAGATIGPGELEAYEATGFNRIVVGFGNTPNREVLGLMEKLASRVGAHLSP